MTHNEERLIIECADLKEQIAEHERSEAAKFRRLDCLRVSQKYLEHLGRGGDSLIGTASNLARFVESGDSGEPAKQSETTSRGPH